MEWMWKEASMVYLKVLSQHVLGMTDKYHTPSYTTSSTSQSFVSFLKFSSSTILSFFLDTVAHYSNIVLGITSWLLAVLPVQATMWTALHTMQTLGLMLHGGWPSHTIAADMINRESTLQLQKVNCRQHFGQSVAFCNDIVLHMSSKCISNTLHPVVYLVMS
jgi:hypothetical protein